MFGQKNYYKESLKILAEQGYSDEYVEELKKGIAAAKGTKAAEGICNLTNAYIFRGELSEAVKAFENIEMKRLKLYIAGILAGNMMLCLFILNKFKEADELFEKYNDMILRDNSVVMKRSLAIHEHIRKRYENSVTILIKIIDEADPRDTMFVDICLIKSFLRLDMYERAFEFSKGLDRYNNKNELTDEVAKIRKKIFDNLSAENKVKMIKKRVK